MDPPNALQIVSIENNCIISKKEILLETYFDWNSIDNLKDCSTINFTKIKYFDEEGELISLFTNDDFMVFKELLLEKKFPCAELVVIAYEGSLDMKKFGRLDKVKKLKCAMDSSTAFVHIKSFGTSSNKGSLHRTSDDFESTSSTSSSSPIVRKRKPQAEKGRKYKHIIKYAAKLKKELNYLPGSEVSDGQTIVKKWRVKNIGSKKWKENSVKSVLLPSEYSNWISYSPLRVPFCFADQKVDIEIEISINGQWETIGSSPDLCSRDINLTWLIFKDSLPTKSGDNFKDYILMQLELCIVVKKRSLATDIQPESIGIVFKKNLSESSIERIDNDFSFVDVSEEDQNCDKQVIDQKVTSNDSDDLELPDCPNGDDLEISDFINPDNCISAVLNKPEEVAHVFMNEKKEGLDEDLVEVSQNVVNNEEQTVIDELTFNSSNIQELPASIDEINGHSFINIQEIPLETNFYEVSEMEPSSYHGNDEEIKSRSNEEEKLLEFNCGDISTSLRVQEEVKDVNKESEPELININESTECVSTSGQTENEPINNQSEHRQDNPIVPRQMPVDSIRNEFPRSGSEPIQTTQYVPGCPYPVVSHQMNYVAGLGQSNVMYNATSGSYAPTNVNYYPPATPYNYQAGVVSYPNVSGMPAGSAWTPQNNDREVIENLRRSGHLPGHINEASNVVRADNGQHYLTGINLEKLKAMGFTDEQRNYRLLMKFQNNINDVINDLID